MGQKCLINRDCDSFVCTSGKCQYAHLSVSSGQTVVFDKIAPLGRGQVKDIALAALTLNSKTEAATFTAGREVLLIYMQGTTDQLKSIGNYELLKVKEVSGEVVTLTTPPTKHYGNATGNTKIIDQLVFLIEIPTYSDITVSGNLIAQAWNGTPNALGIIALRATGKLRIEATGAIRADHLGYRSDAFTCNGVSGRPGESTLPRPVRPTGECYYNNPTNQPNQGGGGGALSSCNTYNCSTQQIGGSGGGASYATSGTAGNTNGNLHLGGLPGLLYGQTDLSQIFLGSGGGTGAGGYSGPGTGTPGGHGGGLILLLATEIEVLGHISANGQNGGDNHNCAPRHGSGSGGGGSGGSIYISAPKLTLPANVQVSAIGGQGGCLGGGTGGHGRIRLDYSSLNGQTYPNGSPALTQPQAYLGSANK